MPSTTVYGRWHGGSSYTHPYPEDTERFASIKAAKEAMRSRRDNGYWQRQDFDFIHKAPDSTFTPTVDESSYVDLYCCPEDEEFFARLEFGPRGGIQQHSA